MERNINGNKDLTQPKNMNRRDVIKGLATLPFIGAFAGAWVRKNSVEKQLKNKMLEVVNLTSEPVDLAPAVLGSKPLRLGIVGYGIRGRQLLRATGHAEPKWIDDSKAAAVENPLNTSYDDFMNQEGLDVVISGVCDIFDIYAGDAAHAGSNVSKEGTGGKMDAAPRRYRTYKEMMASPDIDAVIIATPDHWHATMAIEAARNGKHVYLEKPMTWTVPETYELVKAVRENKIVFQLGHQGRQTESYIKAKEVVHKNILGKITLVEVCTNRNDPNGAWVYPIHPEAGHQNIDWQQFLGPAPYHDFSLERFFRWRCWWDYSTGLNGDLLTHEYDCINQIMGIGIPDSVVASGGIYFFKDGRTVPDVQNVVMEFPGRDLTFLYSASLASDRQRGKVIMGHDAHMELSDRLIINADPQSTAYKEKIQNGTIDPQIPIYTFTPGKEGVDGAVSATEQYFASRGLLYTYRQGKRVDTTFLHMREWVNCIRAGIQPSCNIDRGFEEAITAHMATIALREGRKVYWDREKQEIVVS
ncbi:MAG: Gfo/Idh/MocA family oxidoreductase [Bacteroidales bacterium]|nr:Gfo/Idh/MocA family oxidoreductase [Bacteroidales bacterium]MBN2763679.1 Gfo/Idh/MocA family oxidoreductase [Bacteroidales bacterium]